ncbi:MAG: metallophosphoesterase family protein [Anaerolineales bacterium]|nr:metallophosphoesterase family protein [Anaerolineales bacterium]
MIVALLGDIHANLPALEAVIAHAQAHHVQQYWNTGDFLGYGAFPNEIFDCLHHIGAVSIVGNYDLKVLNFPTKQRKWKKNKRPGKYLAFKWAHEQLLEENAQYLRSLPEKLEMEIENRRILMVHGSPESIDEMLCDKTPVKRLENLAKGSQVDVIVCGHTHQAFLRQVQDVWFVNPGSVGRPGDGDPRAAYALLDIRDDSFGVQQFRIDYDIARAVDAIRKAGLPEAFAQMIQRGYDLETLDKILASE